MQSSIDQGDLGTQRQTGVKESVATKLGESLSETAADVGARASAMAGDVAESAKQHPYTTLLLAAGVAFTVGALWKVRSVSRQSQLEQLMSYAQGLPAAKYWRNTWR